MTNSNSSSFKSQARLLRAHKSKMMAYSSSYRLVRDSLSHLRLRVMMIHRETKNSLLWRRPQAKSCPLAQVRMHLPPTLWPKVKPLKPLQLPMRQQQMEHPPQKVKVKHECDNIALKIINEYMQIGVNNTLLSETSLHCFASQK